MNKPVCIIITNEFGEKDFTHLKKSEFKLFYFPMIKTSSENFESNWDYRHRAERIAANWITKHGAKSVKLYQIGRGQPKKLVHTYTRTLEEGAA